MYFSLSCPGNTASFFFFFLPIGDPINGVSLYDIVGPKLCSKDTSQSESFSIFLILLHCFIFILLLFWIVNSCLPKKSSHWFFKQLPHLFKDLKNLWNKYIFQKIVQCEGPTRPINAAPRKDDDNEGKDDLFSSGIFSSKQINAVSFEA